jgi:hypothetical protein
MATGWPWVRWLPVWSAANRRLSSRLRGRFMWEREWFGSGGSRLGRRVWSAVAAMTSTVRGNVFALGFVVSGIIGGLMRSYSLGLLRWRESRAPVDIPRFLRIEERGRSAYCREMKRTCAARWADQEILRRAGIAPFETEEGQRALWLSGRSPRMGSRRKVSPEIDGRESAGRSGRGEVSR